MGASFLNTTPHGRHNTLDVYCIIVHCTSSLHIVICNRYFCRIARIFFVCQKSMFHLILLFFIKMGVVPEQKIFKKIQIVTSISDTHKKIWDDSKKIAAWLFFLSNPDIEKTWTEIMRLVQFWRFFGPQIHIFWSIDFIFSEHVPFMST